MTFEDVDYLEIIFENCDFCKIPIKEEIGKVEWSFSEVVRAEWSSGKVSICQNISKEVRLLFSKEILQIQTDFERELNSQESLIDQLKFRNISLIRIVYVDGSQRDFYVDYIDEKESDLGSPNINQTNEFLEDGSCIVRISRNDRQYW